MPKSKVISHSSSRKHCILNERYERYEHLAHAIRMYKCIHFEWQKWCDTYRKNNMLKNIRTHTDGERETHGEIAIGCIYIQIRSNGSRAFYATSSVKCSLVFEVYLLTHCKEAKANVCKRDRVHRVFASKQTIAKWEYTTTGAHYKYIPFFLCPTNTTHIMLVGKASVSFLLLALLLHLHRDPVLFPYSHIHPNYEPTVKYNER